MNNLLLIGVIGTVAAMFRNVPMHIVKALKTNYTSSISVASKNKQQYKLINDFIFALNKDSILNNIEHSEVYDRGRTTEEPSINYGTYFVKLDKMTYGLISKTIKENTFEISSVITITIFGKLRSEKIKDISIFLTEKNSNMIKTFCSLSEWDSGIEIPKKRFEDVYIENKKFLTNKIDKWVENKELYESKGIIHKLGILLYGEAGTGKSSTARAIASYLDYNIYVINLKGYENSNQLMNKLLSIPKKSVILFEDIDCFIEDRANTSTASKDDVLNIALNFIDGVFSPNNCIIIATTNYVEKLDKAIIREGRFDVKLKIENMTTHMAKQMCEGYNVDFNSLGILESHINPAKLQTFIINKINE